MKNLQKGEIEDYRRFYVEKPVGFNPKYNEYVINRVIEKHEANIKRKQKEYIEQVRMRGDAVATYLKAVERGKEANVEKYFGRKFLAELRARKIVSILKDNYKNKAVSIDTGK